MLGASKYMLGAWKCSVSRQSNRLLGYTRTSEVYTENLFMTGILEAEQPFTQSCSELRSIHGAAVFSAMLLASKYARINRLLTNARSIEVCTKQPFTHHQENMSVQHIPP